MSRRKQTKPLRLNEDDALPNGEFNLIADLLADEIADFPVVCNNDDIMIRTGFICALLDAGMVWHSANCIPLPADITCNSKVRINFSENYANCVRTLGKGVNKTNSLCYTHPLWY